MHAFLSVPIVCMHAYLSSTVACMHVGFLVRPPCMHAHFSVPLPCMHARVSAPVPCMHANLLVTLTCVHAHFSVGLPCVHRRSHTCACNSFFSMEAHMRACTNNRVLATFSHCYLRTCHTAICHLSALTRPQLSSHPPLRSL